MSKQGETDYIDDERVVLARSMWELAILGSSDKSGTNRGHPFFATVPPRPSGAFFLSGRFPELISATNLNPSLSSAVSEYLCPRVLYFVPGTTTWVLHSK